jgi:hypothetical protein
MAKAEPRSITRRSLLSGAAATVSAAVVPAAAIPIPAVAPAVVVVPVVAPDPIFAAIEAHVQAFKEFIAVLDDLAVAEQTAWHAPRGQRRAANRRLAEAERAERRFGDLEDDAMDCLIATVPQTLEGAAAVLRYVRERYEQEHTMEEEELMTLLGAIEQAICREAGLPA